MAIQMSIIRDGVEIPLTTEEIYTAYNAVIDESRKVAKDEYDEIFRSYVKRKPPMLFKALNTATQEVYIDLAVERISELVDDEDYDFDTALEQAIRDTEHAFSGRMCA